MSNSEAATWIDDVLPPEDIIPFLKAGLELSQSAKPPTDPVDSKLVRRSQRVLIKIKRNRFPFFELPLEIRNIVYDYLFGGYAFAFRHVNVMVGAINFADLLEEFPCQSNLPAWITLNKQFCFESLRQFHDTAYFCFPYGCELPPFRSGCAPTSLLRLDRARKVVMTPDTPCFLEWEKVKLANGSHIYSIRLSPDCEPLHRQTMLHLKCSGSCDTPPTRALKSVLLEFHLSVPPIADFKIRDVRTNEIGLSLLDQRSTDLHKATGLQKVMIMINYDRKIQWDVYEKAKAGVKREMRRIAGMLIESPGQMYNERKVILTAPGASITSWRFVATSRTYRLGQRADK